jgi:hypothetical protein
MQADTIFIISDGRPTFDRALFDKELKEHERRVAEAEERWSKVAERERERIEKGHRENSDKFWKDIDEENKKRARRGLPPKVFETGGPSASYVPAWPSLSLDQTIEYISALAAEMYENNKKKFPKIYSVAYGADREGDAFLQDLAREFHGRYKRIRGLADPVN